MPSSTKVTRSASKKRSKSSALPSYIVPSLQPFTSSCRPPYHSTTYNYSTKQFRQHSPLRGRSLRGLFAILPQTRVGTVVNDIRTLTSTMTASGLSVGDVLYLARRMRIQGWRERAGRSRLIFCFLRVECRLRDESRGFDWPWCEFNSVDW